MKKILLSLALILATMNIFAQENTTNQLRVTGSHTYKIMPEYTAKMVVSISNVYYNAETTTQAEILAKYIEKLGKVGIEANRIKEDKLHYVLMGYDKEGTVVEFKTKSLNEMQKFLTVKSMGVSKSETMFNTKLTDEEMADFAKGAFADAKKKAEALAKKIDKKIGKAISISDSNTSKINESLYYRSPINEREYFLSVSFELL